MTISSRICKYSLFPSRIEQERINGQHLMIKKMLGGKLFESPVTDLLESGTNVLDSGCGKITLLSAQSRIHHSNVYAILSQNQGLVLGSWTWQPIIHNQSSMASILPRINSLHSGLPMPILPCWTSHIWQTTSPATILALCINVL